MAVFGYVLILPTEGCKEPSIQKIRTEIRKTYEKVDVSKYTPTEVETETKYARYEEYMIKANVDFGNIGENEVMKQNIIRRFCQENVMSGIGESWLFLNVFEMSEITHETKPKLNAFTLGSIVHMNTFVEHFSSLWSRDDKECRITIPTVHFKHDVRKLEINFNVSEQGVFKKSVETQKLHMLELDYNMILRILVEVTKEENLKIKSGFRFVRLYLVMSGAPHIKVSEIGNPDDKESVDVNEDHNKEPEDFVNSCEQNNRGGFQKSNSRGQHHGRGSRGKKTSERNYKENHNSNVSPTFVDDKMHYSRASQFGMEKTSSFCSSQVFGKCRVLRLDLQSSKDNENEVWDTIIQLVACCCEAQVFFTSMKQHEQRKEFPNPSVKTNFSCSYALHTVISPSYSVTDEIHLKYKLNEINQKLVTYAKESSEALEKSLFEIQAKHDKGEVIRFASALDSLYRQNKRYFEKVDSRKGLPENLVLLRRALLTPTRTVFLPPIAHMKSFLLRETDPEFALRVTIRDDNCDQLTFTISGKKQRKTDFLQNAVGRKLMKGFKINDREYRFFGSSTSQLREHGALFYSKDNQGKTAESIRENLGDFSDINIVAKLMARMGQSLSQAMYHLELPMKVGKKINVKKIEDITIKHPKYSGKKYTFSDGIGQMSEELAKKCYQAMKLADDDYKPCAIQIRYAGCKGMIVVNPKLTEVEMVLRESMWKFDSENTSLEILKPAKPQLAYLNRPFITILEQMGVEKSVFYDLQAKQLRQMINSLYQSDDAVKMLHEKSVLRLPFRRLHQCGVNLAFEPFFRPMIMALYSSSIGVLKTKARISLPLKEARTMFGVLDETGTLEYGQVFVQYTVVTEENQLTKETKTLEGEILITKNPCMHPGDVRKFTAVDVKELHHIKDCVVFPQKGSRPHPDEMAGSDLDGDEYCIIWYKPLIFKTPNYDAMDYTSDVKPNVVDDITVQDMVDFMCDYIRDDYVGLIASAHLAWADTEGIFSEKCMGLAKKYSVTLDFAKTGQPEELKSHERVKEYPDFMEKFREKDSYLSTNVLGHLFRNCKSVELVANVLSSEVPVVVNEAILHKGWENYENGAQYALLEYMHLFSTPTRLFHLTNEGEIMSGAVKKLEKTFQGKNIEKNIAKMLDTVIPYVTKKMKHEFYKEFLHHEEALQIIRNTENDKTDIEKLQDHMFKNFILASNKASYNMTPLLELMLQKASAWYLVAYRSKKEGSTLFLGLPWVVPEMMGILHARMECKDTALGFRIKSCLEDKESIGKFLGETPSDDQTTLSQQVMRKWVEKMGTVLNYDKAIKKNVDRSLQAELARIIKSKDVLTIKAEELISECLTSVANSSAEVVGNTDFGPQFWQKKKLGIFAIVALSTVSSTGRLWEVEENSQEKSFALGLKFLSKEYREEICFPLMKKKSKHVQNRQSEETFKQVMTENTMDVAELLQRYSNVGLLKIDFKETKSGDIWYVVLSVYGKPFNIESLKDAIVQPKFESKVIESVKNECCIM